jgi:hypothetical protein
MGGRLVSGARGGWENPLVLTPPLEFLCLSMNTSVRYFMPEMLSLSSGLYSKAFSKIYMVLVFNPALIDSLINEGLPFTLSKNSLTSTPPSGVFPCNIS